MLLRWTGIPDARVIGDADRLPENTQLAADMRERAEQCLRKLNRVAADDAAEPFGWDAASAARLDGICDRILITRPATGTIERAAAEIGSYLGELIIRGCDSWWVYDPEAQAAGVETARRHRFFPHGKVSKRLAHGRRPSVLPFLLARASTHSLSTFYEAVVTGRLEPGTKIRRREAP
jgi:hypothetical protein